MKASLPIHLFPGDQTAKCPNPQAKIPKGSDTQEMTAWSDVCIKLQQPVITMLIITVVPQLIMGLKFLGA